jgi:hypothetical protein
MAEVIAGLSEAMTAPGSRIQASRDALGFDTNSLVLGAEAPESLPRMPIAGKALRRTLSDRSHFIVPLRRRNVAGKVFSERTSVGRARNTDIVLRHQSVSKFHAWFEMDEEARSTSRTPRARSRRPVNGQPLGRPDVVALSSGDVLTFGELEALFCDAGVLWEILPECRLVAWPIRPGQRAHG